MNTSLIPGSLSQLASTTGRSIAETFINADAVVLVDTSASMSTQDARGGQSRYDVACAELASLQCNMPGKIAVLSFSSNTIFCPNGQPAYLGSSTDLAGALQFAKVADVTGVRFIVISDGEPDDASAALRVARTYQNRIDVIYVGSELSTHGRKFLDELARVFGGVHVTADQVHELGATIERLLLATG